MDKFRHREFGAKVLRWRKALPTRTSQSALALKIGVSSGYLAHIETGRSLPSMLVSRDLADALGIPRVHMLQALGHLPEASDPSLDDIPLPPELRTFLTDDWPRLTADDRDLLTDFLHILQSRLNRRPSP